MQEILIVLALFVGFISSWAISFVIHRRIFARVERAKREWEAVFDTVAEWIMVVNEAGEIRRANRPIATALGADIKSLIGRRVSDVFAGHGEGWLAESDMSHFHDPVLGKPLEVTRVRLEGNTIVVARDVGERQKLFSQLAQADKLATIGVLAAGIAHEVNNPSAYVTANIVELKRVFENVIAGNLDEAKLQDEGVTKSDLQEMIADSLEGMGRIRSIVGTLHSISRKDDPTLAPGPVPLNEVIDAVVRTAAPHMKSWGGLLDVSTAQNPVVRGHRGQIVQIMLNLVVNAIQARDGHRENLIGITATTSGNTVRIRISDTGKGISPDARFHIFEPFYTTKPVGLGTGLGLSISRDLVVDSGGTIDVHSEIGKGTVVTVTLPAWTTAELPAADDEPIQPTVPGRLRVLVVDDEPRLLRALQRELARQHDVTFVSDGESALKSILARRPDVILCDISMPVMDGFELHRHVGDIDPGLARRFVFFTGLPLSESLAARVAARGVEAISKSTDFATVRGKLAGLSAR